MNCLYLL